MYIQDIIRRLHEFWEDRGCTALQPIDAPVGAATFHPATALAAVRFDKPIKAVYVQPSRRPADGRYGAHSSRLSKFHQLQVIMQPTPGARLQDQYLRSLEALQLDPMLHDIRFVEDDWKSPSLAAFGLGAEVWCDGMEITQFTYFQQMLGVPCQPVMGEIAYGIERLAMQLQDKDDIWDLDWSRDHTYRDLFLQEEEDASCYYFDESDTEKLELGLNEANKDCSQLIEEAAATRAYGKLLEASHIYNIIAARRQQSHISLAEEMATMRRNAKRIGTVLSKEWM